MKAFIVLSLSICILGFTEAKFSASEEASMEFHEHVADIINGEVLTQEDISKLMLEAELRKSANQTASEYVEDYMNSHFKVSDDALMSSTNRVSIASPGNSDLNESVACNESALKTLISSTAGYYYAYAIRCDGTYKYDAANVTGPATVYVRAEASNYYLEAFILY